MRALVTGVAGFIGSHLAERLLADGHQVAGIDNLLTGRRANVPDIDALVLGDVADSTEIGALFEAVRPEVIYHCAASYHDRQAWERDARTNVQGTINVIRGCQEHGSRLVYFQTSLCYGLTPTSPIRLDAPLAPVGSYAVSKTAAERYIADSGLEYTSFRLANVYGPRNLSGPVPAFYRALAAGETPTVVDTRRDFVFIDDLVDDVMRLTDRRGVWHIGSGRDVSIEALYRDVERAMGLDHRSVPITPRAPDDVPTILLDVSATKAVWGWHTVTPFTVGIERAVAWYAEHGVERTFTHLAIGASHAR